MKQIPVQLPVLREMFFARHSKPIEEVMEVAAKLGLMVDSGLRPGGGTVWITIHEPKSDQEVDLIQRLLKLGFKYWTGKGYWL